MQGRTRAMNMLHLVLVTLVVGVMFVLTVLETIDAPTRQLKQEKELNASFRGLIAALEHRCEAQERLIAAQEQKAYSLQKYQYWLERERDALASQRDLFGQRLKDHGLWPLPTDKPWWKKEK